MVRDQSEKTETWENPNVEETEDDVFEAEVSEDEHESSLLEEMIPFGAAAILPGAVGVALGSKIDEIGTEQSAEKTSKSIDEEEGEELPSLL